MDLRTVKTKKAIRESFLMLRATAPLSDIQVKTICALAFVNKTTFYKHYTDVFALADDLETEAAAVLVDRLHAKDCLVTEPERFVTELAQALATHQTLLATLFRDRPDALLYKLGARLEQSCRTGTETPREEAGITFAVGGVLRVLHRHRPDDAAQAAALLRQMCAGAMGKTHHDEE